MTSSLPRKAWHVQGSWEGFGPFQLFHGKDTLWSLISTCSCVILGVAKVTKRVYASPSKARIDMDTSKVSTPTLPPEDARGLVLFQRPGLCSPVVSHPGLAGITMPRRMALWQGDACT